MSEIDESKALRELYTKVAAENTRLKEENKKLRETVEKIVGFDRHRGYPTGIEWMELVALGKGVIGGGNGI